MKTAVSASLVAFVLTTGVRELPPKFEPVLSTAVERLLGFERTRPRYASGDDGVSMHALIPDPDFLPLELPWLFHPCTRHTGGPEQREIHPTLCSAV